MARTVLHEAQMPFEIKPSEKSVWVCRCGLSKNQPFCDGLHKKTSGEEKGKTYRYNVDGTREEQSDKSRFAQEQDKANR